MKGLYIHIPFCLKKCKYCDFVSFPCDNDLKEAYLDALFNEFIEYKGACVDTFFIGGGTPTSLSCAQLEKLLAVVSKTFNVSADSEFTIEANPKTLTAEKLEILKNGGVNRLSIGMQSFNDDELMLIGRVHTAKDAVDTFNLARQHDFDNISIDLMSALPSQNMDSFKRNIAAAISLNPEHISCYSLILEPNTPLYDEFETGKLTLLDEDDEREIYEYACNALNKAGYEQYEISNFAKKDKQSRHNIKYWECREYIGAGLSAHSYINGVRFSNTTDFNKYILGEYRSEESVILSQTDKMSEFMFMGLRMTNGISEKEFKKRFLKNIDEIFGNQLLKYLKLGMIERENGRIFLSHDAINVSNSIMCDFLL